MKIPDVNVLLYAVNADSPHHRIAKGWLEQALNSGKTVAFPWSVLLAFLRLSTRQTVLHSPLTAEEAFGLIDAWLACPCATAIEPGRKHSTILRRLLEESGTAGNLVSDAHLAALAIEVNAELISFDRDFGRFQGLRWRLPQA